MIHSRHQRIVVVLLVVELAWVGSPFLASGAVVNSAQPFIGVTHYQVVEAFDGSTSGGPFNLPRPLVIDILEIDPTAAGVSFRMQPGNGPEPGEVTRKTTRSFVNSVGAQVGVNGDFYDTFPPYLPSGGQFFTDVVHNGVSNGDAYSPSASDGQSIFNVSADNIASVLLTSGAGSYTTIENVPLYNAIGGNQRLVTNGVNTANLSDPYTYQLNPHTALGVTFTGNVLLMTVDGRQADYSEGMYTTEMADLLINHFNARDMLNVDGGGSTTFVMDDSNDALTNARVVNSPSTGATDQHAGSERLVANSFAVFATPQPGYVPLTAPLRPNSPISQPVLSALTIFDDFEGSKGRFASAVNYSGSSRHIAASSSSSVDSQFSQRGDESLRIDIMNTGGSPGAMQLRLLSGVGSPADNLHNGNKAMESAGYVGCFLRIKPGNDPLYASMMLDDGTVAQNTTERSNFIRIIDDGQWHLYQWNLDDGSQWNNFAGGNGVIDGPNSFIDSIYFSSAPATSGGTNWSGSVWIDTVAYNPDGDLSDLFSILPGDYNKNGVVDAADYTIWRDNLGTDNILPNDRIGGSIGVAQFSQWRDNFGQVAGKGLGADTNSTVPEPATTLLFMLGVFAKATFAVRSREQLILL